MESTKVTVPALKRIALVAHDNKKQDMVEWVRMRQEELVRHQIFTTGTTGGILERELNIPVTRMLSGPLGGDQQLGGKIAQGEIDCLIFFWDPLEPMPHDPDVKALLRLAVVWNIPMACNRATADFIFSSPNIGNSYERNAPDYATYMKNRLSV